MTLKIKTLLLTIVFALVTPTAFAANIPDAGEETGPGLSVLETVLWFVALPGAILGTIWFIWALGNWRKSAKSNEVELSK